MIRHYVPFVVALCCAGPALAQTDFVGMARVAAANQLGVLEYCQGRGDVGADAVGVQRGAIARLPASSVPTDAAEALGREGTLSAPNGARITLADMASTHNTTIAALCKQMGSSAQQAGAYPQGAMAPGTMPAIPQMPQMLGMPAMPGVPSMQGMPAVPGAAPTH